MKTRYALALAGMLLIPAVQAADAPAGNPPPHAMAAGMMDDDADTSRLNLNTEQKAQVQAIRADAKARHDAIRTETRAKIRALLTPEQQKNFDANQASKNDKGADKKAAKKEMKEQMKEEKKLMKEEKNKP